MPRISAVRVKGFQSHVDSQFSLSPGLTVVTGPSDAGKTALIRAIRWVAFNEPSGEAFLNEAVGETEVEITLDNGIVITKRRRKGKTSYSLSTMTEPFEKAEVPEEVKQALGITKQTFGDFETALNFAFQLEAPFLISETASAGAKVLGKLAGTEVVDLATKAVSKDTHQARQERSLAERDMQRIDGDLLEYADLDDLKQQLQACEFLMSELDEQYTKGDKLQQHWRSYIELNEKITGIAERLDALAHVPDLQTDLQDIEKAQQRYDRLLDLYSQLSKTTDQVAVLTEKLAQYGRIEVVTDVLDAATNSNQQLYSLNSLSEEYQIYTSKVNRANDSLAVIGDIGELGTDLHELESRYRHLSGLAVLGVDYGRADARVREWMTRLAGFDSLPDIIARLATVQEQQSEFAQVQLNLVTYRKAHAAYEVAATAYTNAQGAYETASQKLKEVWDGLDVCPLCEQPISGGIHGGH